MSHNDVIFYKSPFGTLSLIEQNAHLKAILFPQASVSFDFSQVKDTELLRETAHQLDAYFQRKLTKFDLPLLLEGTEFQKKVWHVLMKIPYGMTQSYSEIAKEIGCPKGARAVGMAAHRNPLPIIIPCHRVIGFSGKLVGYAGGLEIKRGLLDLEINHNH